MTRRILPLLLSAFLFLPCLFAQAAPEVEITAEPHHRLVFANEQVRVFSVEVAPHSETQMHWHRHDYIFVTLGASEVVNAVKGKDPINLKLRDGQTLCVPAGFAHVARNLAEQPFRNVTVELLQDERLRKLPAQSDDRGLEILHGGTQEILFVKDGVRASEVELQPEGMMPLHHHGACLLVALSDLELRREGTGKSPAAINLKGGESKWISGGSHGLMNASSHAAKFVALEFP